MSAAALVVLLLTGCTQPSAPAPTAVPRPAPPAAADLRSPKAAVRSYLAWTAYGYRIANSDVATPTMGPAEEVRVNSYVEMNKEQGRLIDQQLVSMTFGQGSLEGTTATLPAHERWRYRYLSLADEKPQSAFYTATYDTTYTVVSAAPGRWVVDDVQAKALGTVK